MQLSACWALALALVASTPAFAEATIRNDSGTISTVVPPGWSHGSSLRRDHSKQNLYLTSTVGTITVYADCPAEDPYDFVQKSQRLYGEPHRMNTMEVAGETATRIEWRPVSHIYIDILIPFAEAANGHCWVRFEIRGEPTAERVAGGTEALKVVLDSLRLRVPRSRPQRVKPVPVATPKPLPRLHNDQKTLSVVAPAGWGEDLSMRGASTRVWRKVYLISADANARITISPFHDPKTIPEYLESMKRWEQTPDKVEPTTALGRKSTRISWNGHVYRSVETFVPCEVSGNGFYRFRLVSKEKEDEAFSRYAPALEAVVESLQGSCD